MKKILLMGTMVLVLRGGVLLGQAVQKPYSYTIANGIGECTFTGVSLDEVWTTLVKTFMTQDTKGKGSQFIGLPVVLDRPSNRMTGTWIGCATWIKPACRIEILVEQRSEGIGVYFTASGQDYGRKKDRENIEKAFFDKVVELLYRKVEK